MAIEYRVGKVTDLKQLLPLVEAFAREQQDQIPVNELAENFMEFARSGLAQAVEHPAACVMVAEELEGKPTIVGYAVGMLQEPPAIFKPELYTFISDLYVTPEYRRKGIGSALVERVRGWGFLKGAYRLSLIIPTGSPAQGLYEKLGFRAIQTMLYAGDGE
ncbi:MAG: GNAT family N-acetyltransferase [Bacillota bacterium]